MESTDSILVYKPACGGNIKLDAIKSTGFMLKKRGNTRKIRSPLLFGGQLCFNSFKKHVFFMICSWWNFSLVTNVISVNIQPPLTLITKKIWCYIDVYCVFQLVASDHMKKFSVPYFHNFFVYLNGCLKIILIVLVHDFNTPTAIIDLSALSIYIPHFPWHSA